MLARNRFGVMPLIVLSVALASCDQHKATEGAPKVAKIDYGVLERPDMQGFDFDPDLNKRTPQQSIEKFRDYEKNIPQGLDWNALEEHLDHQRALYYLAAEKSPELITDQDRAWLKADEASLVESACDNADSTGERFKVSADVCSKLPKR